MQIIAAFPKASAVSAAPAGAPRCSPYIQDELLISAMRYALRDLSDTDLAILDRRARAYVEKLGVRPDAVLRFDEAALKVERIRRAAMAQTIDALDDARRRPIKHAPVRGFGGAA